jgi:hypothetical protein
MKRAAIQFRESRFDPARVLGSVRIARGCSLPRLDAAWPEPVFSVLCRESRESFARGPHAVPQDRNADLRAIKTPTRRNTHARLWLPTKVFGWE